MSDDRSVEILPPGNSDLSPATGEAETALLRRVARSHPPSAGLQALIEGPLRDAIAAAAEYATDAIAEPTRKAYVRDWAEFSGWCRENGADPANLPVNPVLVAAWLATLAATHGSSALGRSVAAIAYHHRRRGLLFVATHPAIRDTLSGIQRARPQGRGGFFPNGVGGVVQGT